MNKEGTTFLLTTHDLSEKNPIEEKDFDKDGISITGKGCEWEILVDNDKISMGQFITWLHSRCDILDVSIKEPAMEEIIKTIHLS